MKTGRIFIVCSIIYLLSYFQRSCPAVLSLDLMRDLHLDTLELGYVSGATILAYGLMQIPAGLITDYFGSRKTIIAFTVLTIGASIIFASSFSFGAVVGSRFLIGIGVSILAPVTVLICTLYPPEKSGRVLGFIMAAGSLGVLLASAPLAALSDLIGWRFSLISIAAFTALVLAFFVIYAPRGNTESEKKRESVKDALKGLKQVLTTGKFWPLCLWVMFLSGSMVMLNSLWWGPYLMQGQHLSKISAGAILMIASFSMIISQPIFGWFSDVVNSRKLPMIIASCVAFIACASFALWQEPQTEIWLILQAIFIPVGLAGTLPCFFTLAQESFPANLTGRVIGCVNMFPQVWAFVLQSLFGVILNNGLEAGLDTTVAFARAGWLLVFNAAGALCMLFFIREKRNLDN